MRNSLLLLSLFSLSVSGSLLVPQRLGNVSLMTDDHGWAVYKDKKVHRVESDCMDPMLRQMDYKQRALYLVKGGSVAINQASDGQYTLKSVASLKGGGLFGAAFGAKLGMFCAHFLGHGAILIAGFCSGPAMPATILALEATFGPSIIIAGKAAAIAGGIIGGVATGPV